ncbi:MAG: FHA domain-containing protein [Alphaproteobacteria bacterium]|nr:FHA domain-containing protein [Alphaproteobacteria bacterium]
MFTRTKPYIEFSVQGGKRQRRTIDIDQFSIGSGEDADLRLQSSMIADRHLVIARSGDDWVVRVVGLNPVEVNGVPLAERDRTIGSDDDVNIAGLVSFRLVDPAAAPVKTDGKPERAAAVEPATAGGKSNAVTYLFSIVMLGSAVAAYLMFLHRPADTVADLTTISSATIDRVVDSLPDCITAASERVKAGAVRPDLPADSIYWALAKNTAAMGGDGDKVSSADLQRQVREWLVEGFVAEQQGDGSRASRAYQVVRTLVPDLQCRAHLLASSRYRIAAQSR